MSAFQQLAGRVQAAVADDRKKIGGMTLSASLRLGLAELRQAASIDGSVAAQVPTPYGMYGAAITPGEVSAARQDAGVHGPTAEVTPASIEADPVQSARQQAVATVGRDREPARGLEK